MGGPVRVNESYPAFSCDEIWKAKRRIASHVYRTPLLFSPGLSRQIGCEIYLKMECWQLCGCFKVRGAVNMIAALSGEQRKSGLATCSSGNHGAAVAFAAGRFGRVEAKVFVPENAERAKTRKIEMYGAQVVHHGKDFLEAFDHAVGYTRDSGGVFVHSHGHPLVIAGQGTIGLEIVEDLPDVEAVVVPVGGGGLISGIVTAVKSANDRIGVFGVESSAAPGAHMSFRDGHCHERISLKSSIADGLMGTLTPLTFALTYKRVEEIAVVDDAQIVRAMRMLQEQEQLMVEGSAAVGLAAILEHKIDLRNRKVVLVLTGRNISWERYRALLEDTGS
jgi:threonine dehydratase